ncbi:MAG TPA: FAD-dependent oxidoreductase [Ferrovibrio sp.]|uniref:NAD(P)/FAD-dependent oxidoreductase n=1 Tax=Ferrovibrio sp. TaxID=1917215 RepID=UPI002ED31264
MSKSSSDAFDVIVVGGGIVGSSIAWGLAKLGQKVAVLDEGDDAYRASRGNFALIWVQSKGLGMPAYAAWTVRSARAWPGFAEELRQQTGFDLSLQQNGGFQLALSEPELETRAQRLRRLQDQPDMPRYGCEILPSEKIRAMLPAIGPQVVGGSYCPLDGHVNSLRLFRALHAGMQEFGTEYRPNHNVDRIECSNGEFRIHSAGRELRSGRLVLAAGLGNRRLAPMVGLDAPVRPQRGQLIVTEKTMPFLPHPIVTIRQADEGGVMIGDSHEEAGFDSDLRTQVLSVMADRAIRMFPVLAGLNVVRSWAALRVMTKDGFPVYEQSETCPGAFIATCHSGITLAASHALILPRWIVQGERPAKDFGAFSARRFHVPSTA